MNCRRRGAKRFAADTGARRGIERVSLTGKEKRSVCRKHTQQEGAYLSEVQ